MPDRKETKRRNMKALSLMIWTILRLSLRLKKILFKRQSESGTCHPRAGDVVQRESAEVIWVEWAFFHVWLFEGDWKRKEEHAGELMNPADLSEQRARRQISPPA